MAMGLIGERIHSGGEAQRDAEQAKGGTQQLGGTVREGAILADQRRRARLADAEKDQKKLTSAQNNDQHIARDGGDVNKT